jgi:hypothetical protein
VLKEFGEIVSMEKQPFFVPIPDRIDCKEANLFREAESNRIKFQEGIVMQLSGFINFQNNQQSRRTKSLLHPSGSQKATPRGTNTYMEFTARCICTDFFHPITSDEISILGDASLCKETSELQVS